MTIANEGPGYIAQNGLIGKTIAEKTRCLLGWSLQEPKSFDGQKASSSMANEKSFDVDEKVIKQNLSNAYSKNPRKSTIKEHSYANSISNYRYQPYDGRKMFKNDQNQWQIKQILPPCEIFLKFKSHVAQDKVFKVEKFDDFSADYRDWFLPPIPEDLDDVDVTEFKNLLSPNFAAFDTFNNNKPLLS